MAVFTEEINWTFSLIFLDWFSVKKIVIGLNILGSINYYSQPWQADMHAGILFIISCLMLGK